MQMKQLPHTTAKPPGPLRKMASIIVAAALIVPVLMFSAVLLATLLVLGTIACVYLWWKARELRKQMRNFPPPGRVMEEEAIKGEVIEGEVIRVDEPRDKDKH